MKACFNLRVFLGLAAMITGGYALYAAMSWPLKTALFPQVIGLPLLLLAGIETALCLFGSEEARTGPAVDFELTKDIDPVVARRRRSAIAGWIFAFLILILAFGFPLAVPIFVFLNLKFGGKEGWILTLLLTFVSWAVMEFVFERLLHLPFAPGWIFALLT
jgi:hypothetical protein